MVVKINYSYGTNFEGNVLVVGRIGCGKTTFVQNLGKNKMFGNIKEVTWASKILLSKEREDQIRGCFVDEKVDFNHVETIDEFDDLLEYIHRKRPQCKENNLGENIQLDRLVVLDYVSDLADRSDTFANC